MKKILCTIAILGLVSMNSGCAALFGEGDYQSYATALSENSESEKGRITSQAYEISTIAQESMKRAATPTEALLIGVISSMQIASLSPHSLNITKPTTGMDVAMNVAGSIPIVANAGFMYGLGKVGIKNAGQISFGDQATVSSSFNETQSLNLGSGIATASGTAVPTVVEQPAPIIVDPVIVQ
jgi:hypothetical protein